MDVDDMRYLIETVRCGYNITKASSKLYISQPALTKIIRKTESELGCEIFLREKNKICGLSENGAIVVAAMESVVKTYEDMLADIRSRSLRTLPTVTIGIVSAVYESLFRGTVGELTHSNTGIQVELFQASLSTLLPMLHEGRIDLLIHVGDLGRNPIGLASEPLHVGTYAMFCHKRHPLASRRRVSFQEVCAWPLAVPPLGTMTHQLLFEQFDAMGLSPEISLLSMDNGVLLDSTQDRSTVAVLPRPLFMSYGNKGDVAVCELEQPIQWNLNISHRDDGVSPAVSSIREQTKAIFEEQIAQGLAGEEAA